MNQTTELEQIYRNLPAVAQREALDFMVFLKQRYTLEQRPATKPSESLETSLIEHDGLLFIRGQLSGNLDSLLQQDIENTLLPRASFRSR